MVTINVTIDDHVRWSRYFLELLICTLISLEIRNDSAWKASAQFCHIVSVGITYEKQAIILIEWHAFCKIRREQKTRPRKLKFGGCKKCYESIEL